ncbi:MAG: hypothetical protein ACI9Z3_001601 [Roseivirga sp.]|jgi:hypothetical protein
MPELRKPMIKLIQRPVFGYFQITAKTTTAIWMIIPNPDFGCWAPNFRGRLWCIAFFVLSKYFKQLRDSFEYDEWEAVLGE